MSENSNLKKVQLVSLKQIYKAKKQIKNYVRVTPLEYSPFLSKMAEGSHVYIKCENLQRTGSFKVRGAFNKLCLLKESNPDIYKIGAVAASTGNHAMACTEAMNQLGIPVHVFVPETISPSKHERLIANKASLTVFGEDCMYAENAARKYSEEKGIPFISPYNDIDVIAGQGTIGLEIFEEQPDIENVFVPVGGGGLIAGIAAYLKQVNPDIKVTLAKFRCIKKATESVNHEVIAIGLSEDIADLLEFAARSSKDLGCVPQKDALCLGQPGPKLRLITLSFSKKGER
ncbi:L-threonine dehydratase catabolic TdcB [Octopus bimaculoides]|uniref:L-threonine dehydratase catabolic TdcB n=1 Tax=Octopus bimaculoides TaxID=37653 RepID=UPI00071E3E0C|nr:L-threonine dehydratase catabolic TdcB [Octopus bimaculoides]|eukprot:XP_014770999.1 PREDICTED: L-threonine dehydratase catabolic TdcB-like [Octopus bimaculoides]